MDPQFQTSFIPKKPIISGSRDSINVEKSTNIFSVVSVIIFIAVLALSVGLFIYKNILVNQITDANKKIVAAREAFQPETIKELISVSTQIMSAQRLLQSHVAPSQIFYTLQSLTFKKISLNNFIFIHKDGATSVSADMEAQSYNALAQQSDLFSKTVFIQKPNFENFNVLENGNITSKFSAVIDPSIFSYKNAVDALNLNP